MASSRVMASSSSANSDLTRQSSLYSLTLAELQSTASGSGDPSSKPLGSMSMDDILRNIYGDADPAGAGAGGGGADLDAGEPSISRQGSFTLPKGVGAKTVDEVWRDISAGGGRRSDGGGGEAGEMTLEDFLARAVEEEGGGIGDPMADPTVGQQLGVQNSSVLGFGNVGGRGGRGRKRAAMDPVDKAALQRQKRMIKNRESAARSRERKQAYTVELKSLVTTLEDEHARLVRLELMTNHVPREDEMLVTSGGDRIGHSLHRPEDPVSNNSSANQRLPAMAIGDSRPAVEACPDETNFNILKWWQFHGSKYPTLAVMARDMVAIPLPTQNSNLDLSRIGKFEYNRFSTIEALVCLKDWLRESYFSTSGLLLDHPSVDIHCDSSGEESYSQSADEE